MSEVCLYPTPRTASMTAPCNTTFFFSFAPLPRVRTARPYLYFQGRLSYCFMYVNWRSNCAKRLLSKRSGSFLHEHNGAAALVVLPEKEVVVLTVVCLTHFPHSYSPTLSCTVTNLTHQISYPRVFDDSHWSSHYELCHRSRGSTSCPDRATCRCVFPSFSSPSKW
jgi:hypothetical protein